MPDAAGVAALVAERVARLPRVEGPPLVGLNGARGAGKSTLAKLIAPDLDRRGLRSVPLSLDDFFLTRAERTHLARKVHPMCGTRGVPGAHDMTLLETTLAALAGGACRVGGWGLPRWRVGLAALAGGEESAPPRFDKLADDRLPPDQWPVFSGRADVIILEGWCVGLLSDDLGLARSTPSEPNAIPAARGSPGRAPRSNAPAIRCGGGSICSSRSKCRAGKR